MDASSVRFQRGFAWTRRPSDVFQQPIKEQVCGWGPRFAAPSEVGYASIWGAKCRPQTHAACPRLRFGLVLCASATRLQLDGLQAADGDRIGTPVLAELAVSDDAHGLTGIASQIDSRRRLQVGE